MNEQINDSMMKALIVLSAGDNRKIAGRWVGSER